MSEERDEKLHDQSKLWLKNYGGQGHNTTITFDTWIICGIFVIFGNAHSTHHWQNTLNDLKNSLFFILDWMRISFNNSCAIEVP